MGHKNLKLSGSYITTVAVAAKALARATLVGSPFDCFTVASQLRKII